uniref:Uncharacterized protein n=1 Tax=Rhizophora mucronata TaxID=61149 RepID=A0A2P2P420_RHIMU
MEKAVAMKYKKIHQVKHSFLLTSLRKGEI